MYVVTVEFEIRPEHTAEFQQAMLEQATNSLAHEAACRQFDVCFEHDHPTKCFLYEKYDDRAAFDLHLQTTHFKDFDAKVASWIASKTVKTWYQASPSC